ncbi:MAG: L-histidine N(alpha)-methyltransferase [Actinomycetota bacterium]|nr:L-histidine N(alpha)-methyltransferase [Actinomycetota bacterium]
MVHSSAHGSRRARPFELSSTGVTTLNLSTISGSVRVEVCCDPGDRYTELCEDVRRGLTAGRKWLPAKWLYDERGSQLFDQITRLPEYYPTRRERAILATTAASIASLSGADTLVELGSGTSEKTRVLLDALSEAGQLQRYVPFDVSHETLACSAGAVATEYPGLEVHAVAGDFDHHLDRVPVVGRRLVAFLGGTIGNLRPAERALFLSALAGSLRPGDCLLLGTDLVKERRRLVAAYDDTAGVTAAFTRNLLAVLNREVDADFNADAFEHVARWNAEQEWVELGLRSRSRQLVTVSALDLGVEFEDGEELRTEISAKFRRQGVADELKVAGLDLVSWWTDAGGDYALSLSSRSRA